MVTLKKCTIMSRVFCYEISSPSFLSTVNLIVSTLQVNKIDENDVLYRSDCFCQYIFFISPCVFIILTAHASYYSSRNFVNP